MKLTVTMRGDVTVVAIPFDHLDARNVSEFKAEIAMLFNEHKKVILDCGQLQFVDSSGLGAIMYCMQTQNASGCDLKLASLNKGVRALFELVRMHRMIGIFNTVDEAVKAF
ncbi:MAG: STAS domain-containing protein [Armatimonadota bacterium]